MWPVYALYVACMWLSQPTGHPDQSPVAVDTPAILGHNEDRRAVRGSHNDEFGGIFRWLQLCIM